MEQQFYTMLTNIGKASITNAALKNTKVNFQKLVLGDSNGSYYEPSETQTQLRKKVWEGQISNIQIDETNPNWIIVETIIDGSVGGFTIREAGLVDERGQLLVIAKYPETYKPSADDGTIKDLIVRLILKVSNASVVTLKIDPAVILATKKDVIEMGKTKAPLIHNHDDRYHTKSQISTLLDSKMNNIVTETDIVLLDSRIKKLNHYKNKIKKIGNIVQISAGLQTTSRIELSKPLNYLEFPLFDIPVGFRPTEWLAVYPSGSNNFSMIECTIYNIKMFIEGTIEKNVNIFFSMTYISK